MKKNCMSKEMYDFIVENEKRLKYDLEIGMVITPKGTNGTVCSSTGYLRAKVGGKTLQVHQILAVKYFGEACIGKQVNHKDGNKLNNRKENLEVCTQLENLKHQKECNLLGTPNPINKIPVDQLDLNDNYLCSYESINDATRAMGLKSANSIRSAIRGYDDKGKRHETAGGFKWRVCLNNVSVG